MSSTTQNLLNKKAISNQRSFRIHKVQKQFFLVKNKKILSVSP